MTGPTAPTVPDLRSTKRAATIRHIQQVALELFDERGYDSVSMAQIARAAEVGERSVYRYFGSKPMLLFHDEVDTASMAIFAERFRRDPALTAVRSTLRDIAPLLTADTTADLRRRLAHIYQHPELQAALAAYTIALGDELGGLLAVARGNAPDDLAAQIEGRCIATALTAAVERWYTHDTRLADELDRAMQILGSAFTPTRRRSPRTSRVSPTGES